MDLRELMAEVCFMFFYGLTEKQVVSEGCRPRYFLVETSGLEVANSFSSYLEVKKNLE